MSALVIGQSILNQRLLKNGKPQNLKHSTYDLSIGKIYPAGENRNSIQAGEIYYLKPNQAVLVLSEEEFGLPGTITGIATLRTTLTKMGLLALNVGIIDPFFNGPISTTLINFSGRPVPIEIGMRFFRVVFFEHENTTEYHAENESKKPEEYDKELRIDAYREFPKNFMNMPEFDRRFYAGTAMKMLKGWAIVYWYLSIPALIFITSTCFYIIQNDNYQKFLMSVLKAAKDIVPFM